MSPLSKIHLNHKEIGTPSDLWCFDQSVKAVAPVHDALEVSVPQVRRLLGTQVGFSGIQTKYIWTMRVWKWMLLNL